MNSIALLIFNPRGTIDSNPSWL